MSPTAKREYLQEIKPRYQLALKTDKQFLLDEFCTICQYQRKYAIRLWIEQQAVCGKGESGVTIAVDSIENYRPFPLKGFDCDNGSEFLNWHLVKYFDRRKQRVHFTRSRPNRKNDNAHIEEKNWSQVRLYLGYQRFEKEQLFIKMNDLYCNEWNDYFNFFIPSIRLLEKYRNRSKIIKIYDKPKIPFQRILESQYIPDNKKLNLQKYFNELNPFELQKSMTLKIKAIINEVNE